MLKLNEDIYTQFVEFGSKTQPRLSWLSDEDTDGEDLTGVPFDIFAGLYREPMTFGPEWRTAFKVIEEFELLLTTYNNSVAPERNLLRYPFTEYKLKILPELFNDNGRIGKFVNIRSQKTFHLLSWLAIIWLQDWETFPKNTNTLIDPDIIIHSIRAELIRKYQEVEKTNSPELDAEVALRDKFLEDGSVKRALNSLTVSEQG